MLEPFVVLKYCKFELKDLSFENSKYQKHWLALSRLQWICYITRKVPLIIFFCIIIEVNQPSKNTTWNNGNNFSSLFSPYFSLLGCENIVWDWNWWLFFQVQELSLPLIASKCTPGAFHTLSISGAFFSRFLSGKTCRLLAAVLGPKKQRKISNFRHTVAFFLLLSQVNFFNEASIATGKILKSPHCLWYS